MLSQAILNKPDNESLSIRATELTSIHIDPAIASSVRLTPPIVDAIHLTNTTAKLEKLLKDISKAKVTLEKNIVGKTTCSFGFLLGLTAFFGTMGGLLMCLSLSNQSNDRKIAGIEMSSILFASCILFCVINIRLEHASYLNREKRRRNGKYDSEVERLRRCPPLTVEEVEQIQKIAQEAGIHNSCIQNLTNFRTTNSLIGHIMRAARAALLRQEKTILNTVQRNHEITSTLNMFSIPSPINTLIVDFECDYPKPRRQ